MLWRDCLVARALRAQRPPGKKKILVTTLKIRNRRAGKRAAQLPAEIRNTELRVMHGAAQTRLGCGRLSRAMLVTNA
jgi:hypothetical protein